MRIVAALRQEDVAGRIGRPQSYVSKYESGERSLDVLEIRTICLVMGSDLITFAHALEQQAPD